MIARIDDTDPHRFCQPDRLVDLLADRLPTDESARISDHLGHCEACRRRLETLAAGPEVWSTVADALRTDASDRMSPEPSAGTPSSVDGQATSGAGGIPRRPQASSSGDHFWVRSLLRPDPCGGWGVLGAYPIDGVIGQGGMGIVLKGWDRQLHRPLAIKLLSPHLSSSGAARERFLREARAAAAVVHPAVVPIYAIHAEAALPYLVMPFVAGGTLQQRLDRDGPLDLADALRIALQISEGLEAAHRQGLIHRDVKPANVLLEEGGHRALLSDFGLARAFDDVSMTASGIIAGTPPYMSPEQARGQAVGHRSDLFSLGSLLYAMTSGRPPFRGETAWATLRQVSERPPTPLRDVNERLPRWVPRLVGWLMQKDPADRPASAADVAAVIQGCLAHVRSPDAQPLPERLRTRGPWRVAVTGGSARTGLGIAIVTAAALSAAAGLTLGGFRLTTPETIASPEASLPAEMSSVDESIISPVASGTSRPSALPVLPPDGDAQAAVDANVSTAGNRAAGATPGDSVGEVAGERELDWFHDQGQELGEIRDRVRRLEFLLRSGETEPW